MKALFTLYIGGEYDRDGKTIPSKLAADTFRDAMQEASRRFGGSTLLFGWGGYINGEGVYVEEKSATLQIITDLYHGPDIEDLAADIRYRLNSESVLLTQSTLSEVREVRATAMQDAEDLRRHQSNKSY